VLYEKNGVITEERFQKLTPAQWVFHYREIMKFKKLERKERENILDVICEYLELVGSMANPEAGKALRDVKQQKQFQQEIDPENFVEYFEELKKVVPPVIRLSNNGTKNKPFLPTFNRKKLRNLGVKMEEGENNGNG
jgi:hypothetical protein